MNQKKILLVLLTAILMLFSACGITRATAPSEMAEASSQTAVQASVASSSQEPVQKKAEESSDKSEAESSADLNSFKGTWICCAECTTADEVLTMGGAILKIEEIDGQTVKGTYTAVQEPPASRIASVDFEEKLSNNKLEYAFDDDGFDDKGTLQISLEKDKIRVTVSTKISEENTSGWCLGNATLTFRREGVEIQD